MLPKKTDQHIFRNWSPLTHFVSFCKIGCHFLSICSQFIHLTACCQERADAIDFGFIWPGFTRASADWLDVT